MVDTPTADTPREPDISHVNPADEGTWFGHPRQLARLFTTEVMGAVRLLRHAGAADALPDQAFPLQRPGSATGLYGGFTALVYLTPLIGGLLADRISARSAR